MERSLFSARYCFVENLHKNGKMCDSEFGVLREWFDFLSTGGSPKVDVSVDLIIYLKTCPKIAFARKKSRDRTEEKVICEQIITRVLARDAVKC